MLQANQVIIAIQKAKLGQQNNSHLNLEQRLDCLLRLCNYFEQNKHLLSESDILSPVDSLRFSIDPCVFYLKKILKITRNENYIQISPSGVVSLILPKLLPIRTFIERFVPAFLAGNGLVVKFSSTDKKSAEFMLQALTTCQFPSEVCNFVQGKGAEIGSILISHPSIKAVSVVGSNSTVENVLKISGLAQKKLQIASGGNNSAILIGDQFSEENLKILVDSCFSGGGILPWNISKIFVDEKNIDQFTADFIKAVNNFEFNSNSIINPNPIEKIIEEGGKLLIGNGISPTLIHDLPHCSVFQQNQMNAPIVLVSGVKYLHESIKWANTGYLGLTNVIIGDLDKARRTAIKLECGQVWINKWISPEDFQICGVKNSFFGIKDFSFFGEFYSDSKNIVVG